MERRGGGENLEKKGAGESARQRKMREGARECQAKSGAIVHSLSIELPTQGSVDTTITDDLSICFGFLACCALCIQAANKKC